MLSNTFSDTFLELTDSLSKYRRAELKSSTGANIIEDLYVDPLGKDLILKSMMKNNTTLLLGRKGTGKSTIINRFQHEVRKTKDKLSLYVDVKALFEQTKKSDLSIQNVDIGLSNQSKEKLNLYAFFIEKIINELKKEIKKGVFQNKLVSFFSSNGITKEEFELELNQLFESVKKPLYRDTTASQQISQSTSSKQNTAKNNTIGFKLSNDSANLSGQMAESNQCEDIDSNEMVKVLSRFFDIIGFMDDLKALLQRIPINNVFICLDDMSEIDKDSMEVFTDFIVGPLNNLSDEYFKFKISLYPGRDFLPSIDRQKVKTYPLDYYDLYSLGSVDKAEESAIKYTKRLIEARFDYYFKNKKLSEFFDVSSSFSMGDFYKLLFQVSSNVPRIMGKILEIALQKTNSLEKKITKRIIQESARQHYKNDIEYILTKSEYIEYKSYDESFEQYHLLELLKRIIEKANANKRQIGASPAKIFEAYTTNTAPSNYLHVSEGMEEVLKTLEFNFFITKYSQQKDKDGENISIFSLNYGLCMDHNIIFDDKSDRKFRIERVFDYNKVIADWMKSSKELICSKCGEVYDIEKKAIFIEHNFPCQKCQGEVLLRPIINHEHKEIIERNVQIPPKEYEVLNTLKNKPDLTATDLGDELDRSYQSIGYSTGKSSKLTNFELIKRAKKGKRPYFSISDDGKLFLNGEYKNKTDT
ncbi:hypothetical protein Q4530_14175 [Colwellia sp. 1_MG-2023]|uniref:hypothetical protein n=1 Tax=unclassified Colwellia TaxID=196834 RepID=UPI001C098C91|nr:MULTISPECIES: hypothetical protein [unclassified Colwellia]MBU2925529.1 hypothetical protein [Colwellia sp. C2M11]MDO6651502.1 hypothetical protein [Colwellia sp. 3_MG-2023]MDO6667073.1 hypothetical protein [Colwellia sp. 2_MG-2023]MDO6690923.1 hypothetical protein [Colwellia sp. 1_MG-2023]